ncbi:dTDP-glucose 4,6-dehydratase [Bacillus sp. FJAT-45350]|uniref:dTDP-glucose 4,6-dehydratase n=1 Tax=Bacillus sp. FJAT-45350 TaxID=2011014 RepID=UPI000BB7CD93|nr:GDP-mannose 4,6-dehydratase [Bacillus sp. FJAT-45350]
MNKEVLVTGGAGFIGSHFIDYLLQNTSSNITSVDCSSNYLEFLPSYKEVRFIQCDIKDKRQVDSLFDRKYDVIVHFAASSNINSSTKTMLDTNIVGTFNLLEAVRANKANKMIHLSTDKVYGSLACDEVPFTELSTINPSNLYTASKASADMLVRAFSQTYQLPLITVRSSNNYGPRQQENKFIPKTIMNALKEKDILVYGDGLQVRDWLFVEDHCRAIYNVMESGSLGEVYNVGGGHERTSLQVVKLILDHLDKSHKLIRHVEDRQIHERRCALNWGKIQRELGWKPDISFHSGLKQTINWYTHNFVNGIRS